MPIGPDREVAPWAATGLDGDRSKDIYGITPEISRDPKGARTFNSLRRGAAGG